MPGTLAPFTLGAATWSLTEYLLHRFEGHGGKANSAFAKEHIQHHAERNYFSPTSEKLKLGIPVVAGIATAASLVAGPRRGLAFAAGFSSMYTYYEVLHRRLHTHAASNAYGEWARKNHFTHHFNSPKKNHGVTSPVWDMVFGTSEPIDVVKVPKRHALDWMVDENGDMKPEYVGKYEFKGVGSKKKTPVGEDVAQADLTAALAGVAPE